MCSGNLYTRRRMLPDHCGLGHSFAAGNIAAPKMAFYTAGEGAFCLYIPTCLSRHSMRNMSCPTLPPRIYYSDSIFGIFGKKINIRPGEISAPKRRVVEEENDCKDVQSKKSFQERRVILLKTPETVKKLMRWRVFREHRTRFEWVSGKYTTLDTTTPDCI